MRSDQEQPRARRQELIDGSRVMTRRGRRLAPQPLFSAIRRLASGLWSGLREACGDAAYDRYLNSKAVRRGVSHPLTAAEFYIEQTNRRYSRPNRCC